MTGLSVEDYSEKAIVVRGEDTRTYKKQLADLGGKYNALLRGGPGWIFSKKMEDKVLALVMSGTVEKDEDEKEVSGDILVQIEKALSVMTPEQKLQFLSNITALATKSKGVCAAKPVSKPVSKPVAKPVPVTKKSTVKTFAKPANVVESDYDESDEDTQERPRLLGRDS